MLVAFLAFLAGVLAAGVLGGPHAALLALLVATIAEVHTRAQAGRAPPWAWPVAVLFVVGAARTEVATLEPPGPDWPVEVLRANPGPHGRISAEVRVEHLRRRDRRATTAEVRVVAFLVDGRRVEAPPDTRALLSGPGILPIVRGGTYAVRARLRAPRSPPDLLNLQWPRPRLRPVLAVSGVADVVLLSGPGIPRPSRLDAWRCVWTTRILGALDGDPGDFAVAVVLGEGRGVDPGLRLALSRLGTAHILAVSGLHVAIAAALAGLVLVRLVAAVVARHAPTANLVLAGLVMASVAAAGVAALAGATPSVTRAAAMCGLATAARLVHRGPRLEACAALAGLADLTLAPQDAFSLSFLLSYAAVLGIAALHRPLARAWTRGPLRTSRVARAAVQGLCVSVAASLATAPVTLVAFGTLGIAAPLANLLVVPLLTFVVMPLAAVVLAAASSGLLEIVAPVARPVFQAFLDGQRALALAVPGADGPLAPLVLPASCSVLAAATAWALGSRRRAILGLGALAFAVLLVGGGRLAWPSGVLSITFLDVGKGDAILVRCPTGRRYLVDTGEARALPRLLRGLAARGVSTLDGVVLTHSDEDHAGAFPALVRAVRVRSVVAPCPEAVRPPLAGMLASVAQDGVRVGCLGLGQESLAGCGADSPVLWPPALAPLSDNAASLVIRLSWAGRSVLLTGDLEAPEEQVLDALGLVGPGADVLKLGHHGSAGSSSARFLAAVRPALAVVSGHASRTRRAVPRVVLDRVAEAGARLRATEDEDDLTILLAPDGIRVLSDKSPPLVLSTR